MTVSAELRTTWTISDVGSNDLGGPRFAPVVDKILQFTDGVAANQANIVFADERTLAASATESLDLSGVLTDAFGVTIAAVKLVAIMVIANTANTNSVVVGAAASNAVPLFGGTLGTISVPPGGIFSAAAPGIAGLCTVTAGTGDLLKMTNSSSGTPVTYQIVILARNA